MKNDPIPPSEWRVFLLGISIFWVCYFLVGLPFSCMDDIYYGGVVSHYAYEGTIGGGHHCNFVKDLSGIEFAYATSQPIIEGLFVRCYNHLLHFNNPQEFFISLCCWMTSVALYLVLRRRGYQLISIIGIILAFVGFMVDRGFRADAMMFAMVTVGTLLMTHVSIYTRLVGSTIFCLGLLSMPYMAPYPMFTVIAVIFYRGLSEGWRKAGREFMTWALLFLAGGILSFLFLWIMDPLIFKRLLGYLNYAHSIRTYLDQEGNQPSAFSIFCSRVQYLFLGRRPLFYLPALFILGWWFVTKSFSVQPENRRKLVLISFTLIATVVMNIVYSIVAQFSFWWCMIALAWLTLPNSGAISNRRRNVYLSAIYFLLLSCLSLFPLFPKFVSLFTCHGPAYNEKVRQFVDSHSQNVTVVIDSYSWRYLWHTHAPESYIWLHGGLPFKKTFAETFTDNKDQYPIGSLIVIGEHYIQFLYPKEFPIDPLKIWKWTFRITPSSYDNIAVFRTTENGLERIKFSSSGLPLD